MTVCMGPSAAAMAFTLLVSVALPIIAAVTARKLFKINSKPILALILIIALIFSFNVVYPGMVESFTPDCGMGISCTPFEYHIESGFCTLGHNEITDPVECGVLKNRLESQPEHIRKLCPQGNIVDVY